MNFFEAEYAKMVRRVRQIRENPDHTKLRATMLLYEQEMELAEHQLEAWKEGRPFCYGPMLTPLWRAMGLEYLSLQSASDRALSNAPKYFDLLRAHGYPDHHCDRTILGVAMILAGDIPAPALTVSCNAGCDPVLLQHYGVGNNYSPLQFCIDIDVVQDKPSERLLAYTANQLGEMVEFAESRIPGVKYDEDRMVEMAEMDRQAQVYLREMHELQKRSPCPIRGQDVFRIGHPRNPSQFPHPEKMVEYYRALCDEIGERAEKGIGVVKEEKARIMWTITAPYFGDLFKLLEAQGASVVHFQVGASARRFGVRGCLGDETEYGRKLTPIEDLARELTFNSWGGLAKRWVDDTLWFSKELKVDGIVNFEQWGCVAAVLTRQILRDRAQAEMGLPCLFIEGRNIDTSTVDLRNLEEQLRQFVAVCIERKAEQATAP